MDDFPNGLMATGNPQSDAVLESGSKPYALDHQDCGHWNQSALLMVDPYGAKSVRSTQGDTVTPRTAGVEPHTPLEDWRVTDTCLIVALNVLT